MGIALRIRAMATSRSMQVSTALARTFTLGLAVAVAACSSGGTSSPSPSPSSKYPNAIAVLGHSGATGFDSNPDQPGVDARGNSWATGDNPTVNSVYLRLLALNPAIRGHNVNVAVSGSDVDNLASQADEALDSQPVPDLFLIQTVDNDIQCDGTDSANYGPFAATLTGVLGRLTSAAPRAKILIVSSPWATVDNYGKVAAQLTGPRAHNSGTGICDLFDPAGKPVPAHWRTLEGITLHYLGELKSVCAKFPACQYDNDALYHMPITTDDITKSDGAHLTIAGLRKQADLEWRVLGIS